MKLKPLVPLPAALTLGEPHVDSADSRNRGRRERGNSLGFDHQPVVYVDHVDGEPVKTAARSTSRIGAFSAPTQRRCHSRNWLSAYPARVLAAILTQTREAPGQDAGLVLRPCGRRCVCRTPRGMSADVDTVEQRYSSPTHRPRRKETRFGREVEAPSLPAAAGSHRRASPRFASGYPIANVKLMSRGQRESPRLTIGGAREFERSLPARGPRRA